FYRLTVGLIAVGVWSNYSSVSDIVSSDAANIASMYRDVSGYPELIRTDLQGQVRGYTEFIIDQAWPAQMRGEYTDDGTRRLNKLAQTIAAFLTLLPSYPPQNGLTHSLPLIRPRGSSHLCRSHPCCSIRRVRH